MNNQDFQGLQNNTDSNWNSPGMDELIRNAPTLLVANIMIINLHEVTDLNKPQLKIQN